MKIELYKPLSIFAQGHRKNMEDYIWPLHDTANETDSVFIVCDGMGGHTLGETASKLACEGFAAYFAENKTNGISEQYFLDAFNFVQGLFDSFINKHKQAKGMGTTLVLLYIFSDYAVVMHCGDSRFYHFRGAKLVWKTLDHNHTNDLLRNGIISEEEALSHPKSNIISRAIQGSSVLKTKPDIHFINDLKPDDYMFLCTDGVNESISDEQLGEILSSGNNDSEKMNVIQLLCEGNSNDNHSAFLLRIRNIITS